MKNKLTLLAAVGCLMLVPSCKDPEEKTVYATNKAGERLVERIDYIDNNTISSGYLLEYNSDGTLKTIKEPEGNRTYSFERRNNTLFTKNIVGDNIEESSFDLNEKGWIDLDRGWEGTDDYRLTYDNNGYLHEVFKGEEPLYTFQWKEGNIVNEEVTYIPTQSHPSNIDWCAFFQSWRHRSAEMPSDKEYNSFLIDIFSIGSFWGFSEGYLGNKCKGLLSSDYNSTYTYDFDKDGFVSTIYINGDPCYKVTYLKR